MHESGDWITPASMASPGLKSRSFIIGRGAQLQILRVSEAAARFPSALAALLATLAMAWLAWRVYGPWTARWLLLLLPPPWA